jgi:DNA-binding CsgD family transcriptional regulator
VSLVPVGPAGLLERDRELAVIAGAVAAASQGRPGLIAIEGPGGIGKTRLLLTARDRAVAAGMRTLAARGSEREQRLPFGVVEQLFAGVRKSPHPPHPVLHRPNPEEAADADESFATFAALLRLTEDLSAERPLMLVVDDLHLCDEPSLQFLGYLVRRLDRMSVSVLATLRPFERTASAPLLGELVGDPLATSVRPSPLSDAATSALLTEVLGRSADPEFAAACREATGGNPLLLTELAKTLRAEGVAPVADELDAVATLGPRAVLRTVLVRLAGLPAGAEPLARAVAVLDHTADLSLAVELAGLDPADGRTAASALIGAEILADGGRWQFVHPLVGSAVYEAIPAEDRAAAHDRAATLLRRRGRPAGEIAAHLVLAPPRGRAWVCELLAATARASLRAGAPADAVTLLERALAEPPADADRAGLFLALGRAAMLVDGPAAEAYLNQALLLAGDAETRALVALDLARLLLFLKRVGDSVPVLRRAADGLGPDAGDLRRRLATVELMASFYDPQRIPSAEHLALGRRLPLEPGLGAKMLAAVTSRLWAYDGGSAEDCAALALAALDGGALVAADNVFLSVTAVLILDLADRPEAEAGWAALLRDGELRGSLASRIAVSLFRGYALARRGELEKAEASIEAGQEALRDWNVDPRAYVHAAAFASWVRRERGDLVGARAALDAADRPEDASDGARLWVDGHIRLLLADGRFEEALAAAQEAERRFVFLVNPLDTSPLLLQAQALAGLARREEAIVAATVALEQARAWGAPGLLARALRVLGRIEGPDGLPRLQAAVDAVRGTPARLELAKSLLALGMALRAAGCGPDARVALREALELAADAGAEQMEARARRELHAAGGRPRTVALTGPAALTASERRVVECAIAGQTNREIAETLFVTRKTVELHLSNAYRKLGIAGRRGLAAALVG